MTFLKELSGEVGLVRACDALGVARASFYRWARPRPPERKPRPRPARTLSESERQEALDLLHSPRFVDKAPREVFATLLDEGRYSCSVRTFYRILASAGEVRERRNQLRHPKHKRPELLATGPGQVWSWDATKLLGPEKWTYYSLYVVLDIFSRYAVGYMVSPRESAELGRRLLGATIEKEGVDPTRLSIHSDRGTAMTSKPVAQLLSDLGVTRSFSRPRVSDDNPFSEAQFKTLKYRPEFPERFGSLEDARAFCRAFFQWYNHEHRHEGIALLTPAAVHHGRAARVVEERQAVLNAAHALHPERFVHGPPRAAQVPCAVWINPPTREPQAIASASPTSENEVGAAALRRELKFETQVSQSR